MKKHQNLSDPVTLRLPRDILEEIEEIEEIATLCDRSRSWVMVRAMKAYLASEGKDIRNIHAAKAEIAEGRHCDLDDVLDDVDAIIKDEAA